METNSGASLRSRAEEDMERKPKKCALPAQFGGYEMAAAINEGVYHMESRGPPWNFPWGGGALGFSRIEEIRLIWVVLPRRDPNEESSPI